MPCTDFSTVLVLCFFFYRACRVNVPLKRLAEGSIEPSGAAAAIPMMTQPSFGAALRGLRHAREALLQPWSTDVTPPKARVSAG
jgi:hypothetical protein